MVEFQREAFEMKEFNKKRLLDNIYFLVKEKNLKLGELESAAGAAPGYLSRLNKEDSKATPSVEFLTAVAERLNVSVDGLIKNDYTTLSSTEKYILDFLNKLIEKTEGFESIWEKLTCSQMYELFVYGDGTPKGPFYKMRVVSTDYSSGYPIDSEEPEYVSFYHPDESVILGRSTYVLDLENGSALYLFRIGIQDDPIEPTKYEYELYVLKNDKASPVCHSCYFKETPFDDPLDLLFTAAEVSTSVPIIGPDVKEVIDEFMTDMSDLPF